MTFMTSITVLLVVMGLEFCVAREGALLAMGEEVARDHRGCAGTFRREFGVELIILFRCCGTGGSGLGAGVSSIGKNSGGIGVGGGRGERWVVPVSFSHTCLTSARTMRLYFGSFKLQMWEQSEISTHVQRVSGTTERGTYMYSTCFRYPCSQSTASSEALHVSMHIVATGSLSITFLAYDKINGRNVLRPSRQSY